MSAGSPQRPFFDHLVVVCLLAGVVILGPTGRTPRVRKAGDLVSVDGISFRAPEPGTTVWAEVLKTDGSETAAGVETRRDGTVILHTHAPGSEMQTVATTSTSPCLDGAYSLYGPHWATTYNWYFKSGSTPSNVSISGAEGAFARAVANITGAHNDCGLADRVSATASYKGRTSAAITVSSTGGCLSSDGRNVVGFGSLPSGYLGATCWWQNSSHQTFEADFKLNKLAYSWTVNVPSGCVAKWVIEAAATHEFGHVFGLAHVSETYHPKLTMSPVIYACQRSETTLGLGDIRGLEALY